MHQNVDYKTKQLLIENMQDVCENNEEEQCINSCVDTILSTIKDILKTKSWDTKYLLNYVYSLSVYSF